MERPEFDRLITEALPLIETATKKYAAIYRLLHEWEDLLQTALLKMLRFAEQYDPGRGDLLPWACVVIINTIKTDVAQSMAVPYIDEINANLPAISDHNPEDDLRASLILSNLNEETRLYIEGYNYPEIAARCGFRSKVTAKNRIDHCAANLRKVMGLRVEQGRRTRMYSKTSG